MNSVFSIPKYVTRSVFAGLGLVAVIALSGCATTSGALHVAPEGLDFDYTVSSDGGHVAVRAFGDHGKIILVLDQPLPSKLRSVPIELPGGARGDAEVRGNYVFVPGRPDRFSVLLPAGRVDVVRSSVLAAAGSDSDHIPVQSPPTASGDEGDGDEVESNLDWSASRFKTALQLRSYNKAGQCQRGLSAITISGWGHCRPQVNNLDEGTRNEHYFSLGKQVPCWNSGKTRTSW